MYLYIQTLNHGQKYLNINIVGMHKDGIYISSFSVLDRIYIHLPIFWYNERFNKLLSAFLFQDIFQRLYVFLKTEKSFRKVQR